MMKASSETTDPRTRAIALHAAYFMEGMRDRDYEQILKKWDKGCIELVAELIEYAPFVVRLVETVEKSLGDTLNHPGVLEYEVSSIFGTWVAEHVVESGDFPPVEECYAWFRNEVIKFFSQGEDAAYQARVTAAVNRVFEGGGPETKLLDHDEPALAVECWVPPVGSHRTAFCI